MKQNVTFAGKDVKKTFMRIVGMTYDGLVMIAFSKPIRPINDFDALRNINVTLDDGSNVPGF